jgi:endonuclease YncB( thermonuclease family)
MPAKTLRLHAAQLALCLAAALGLFFAGGLWAQEERYRGEVVSVADGDTITVLTTDFERIKVRLYGVDCPEKGQPFGQEAKAYLNSLV